MRNPTLPLTDDQAHTVLSVWPSVLDSHTHEVPVTVSYVKRDGTAGEATGVVTELIPHLDSRHSFKVDTERGPRTVNTYNVISLERAGY